MLVLIEPEFFNLKIFRKRQEHDIAKGKAGNAQFINERTVCFLFLFIEILKRNCRFVAQHT